MRITDPPAARLVEAPEKALDRRARKDRRGIIYPTPAARSAISAVENGLSGAKHKGMGDVEVTHRTYRQGMETDRVTHVVIGAAIEVHSALGPGLLESAYRACMRNELLIRGVNVQVERPLRISYKGLRIDVGYRIDFLVEETLIVELKAVERLRRVHEAQLLSYLKLSGLPLGLLINFCVPQLRLGIKEDGQQPSGNR